MRVNVKHIAELSRISLTQTELDKFTPQMETILQSASILTNIDTKDVVPLKKHVSFSDLREDIPTPSLSQEEVLKNAKYTENGYVKVFGKVFGNIEEN